MNERAANAGHGRNMTQPAAHEVDIPFNRARGHFQFARELLAIRVFAALDSLVNLHHSFQRRPGKDLVGDFRHKGLSG
jgi:hypothetical protein